MSASVASECTGVKDRYDTCFLKWYSEKFLKGMAMHDECESLFKDYKSCLDKALKERGIDKVIREAMENNKEHDHEYMSPK